MIKASFHILDSSASFTVKGHSGFSETGSDIVCAAVSSAIYMTANTVTDILMIPAAVDEKDGYLQFSFSDSKVAADVVKGLKLHLEELAKMYPQRIKVTTEV